MSKPMTRYYIHGIPDVVATQLRLAGYEAATENGYYVRTDAPLDVVCDMASVQEVPSDKA